MRKPLKALGVLGPRESGVCRATLPLLAFPIVALALLFPESASAQLFERATVVENVRLRLGSGRVVDGARIIIKGGRIEQLGPDAAKPMLSKSIEGAGRTVTTGFIDIDSRLALGGASAGAAGKAWDGFDRYDTDAIGEAFAGGVTSVCLVPGGGTGVLGTAAVVRLMPQDSGGYGELVNDDVALCVDFGSSGSPVARLKAFESVRGQFRSALRHREAQDAYAEDLEEYEKALKERAEKGDEKKDGEKKPDEKKPDEKKPGAPPPGSDPAKAKGKDNKDDKDDKGPEKPRRVGRRSDLEVILRAIDRVIPVRVEAHYSSDILNALELAEEFDIDLVISGASEAHLVAEELAGAEVRVILEGESGGEAVESGKRRRRHASAAKILNAAGVEWSVGSGGESSRATRHLWDHGVRATRGTKRDLFSLVTSGAARELGMGRRFGFLGRGAHADLVFWSADPLEDPSARVLEVWVGGKKAWSAPAGPKAPEKDRKESRF